MPKTRESPGLFSSSESAKRPFFKNATYKNIFRCSTAALSVRRRIGSSIRTSARRRGRRRSRGERREERMKRRGAGGKWRPWHFLKSTECYLGVLHGNFDTFVDLQLYSEWNFIYTILAGLGQRCELNYWGQTVFVFVRHLVSFYYFLFNLSQLDIKMSKCEWLRIFIGIWMYENLHKYNKINIWSHLTKYQQGTNKMCKAMLVSHLAFQQF